MDESPARRPPLDRRPLLERPDLKPGERIRIGRAVAALLGWGLFAIAVLGFLALWHLVRRGRMLRANLAPPKSVSLPEFEPNPPAQDSP
jgi:hypothetical protein